jgi:hypothetical protein
VIRTATLSLVLTCVHASAADLPDKHHAPAFVQTTRSCGGTTTGAHASLPYDAIECAEVSDSDAATCRAWADQARFPTWREVVLQRCLTAAKWRLEARRRW